MLSNDSEKDTDTFCKRGLKYVHSTGLIHRDLTPSNILVDENCDLKICNFEVSRDYRPQMTGYIATRFYRAPEIMLSWQRYDHQVDMWSAGCIMGEMLLGKPLFPGANHVDQFRVIVDTLGTPPDEVVELITNTNVRITPLAHLFLDFLLMTGFKTKQFVLSLARCEPRHLSSILPNVSSDCKLHSGNREQIRLLIFKPLIYLKKSLYSTPGNESEPVTPWYTLTWVNIMTLPMSLRRWNFWTGNLLNPSMTLTHLKWWCTSIIFLWLFLYTILKLMVSANWRFSTFVLWNRHAKTHFPTQQLVCLCEVLTLHWNTMTNKGFPPTSYLINISIYGYFLAYWATESNPSGSLNSWDQ